MGYFEVIPSEVCDACHQRKETKLGRYIESDGLKLVWLCGDCK